MAERVQAGNYKTRRESGGEFDNLAVLPAKSMAWLPKVPSIDQERGRIAGGFLGEEESEKTMNQ
eukprot:CAMPEP_0170485852 /NCGR_PEP_ID=MMETSP0208-20121228/5018_1 /TAXON_ID=197538 /ORGANISM="Strombidium inclinatum, Strain S3" /LENGTH=63 /DNA_ID=CAMNT_0010759623 /DNA_START=450 /DNA_END=638 /DNA_ORIENTATION=-